MMEELVYKIALGLIPRMNANIVRRMEDVGLGLEEFFRLDILSLSDALGLNSKTGFGVADREKALQRAKAEAKFVERHGIKVLSLLYEDYPWLLSELPDAPLTLYMLGDTDLNPKESVSIVGTRRFTQYGLDFTRRLLEDLGGYFPELMVVSGLAFGVDAAAHNGALDNGLPTVGVVAHGLDTIYPSAHRDLARKMLRNGGAIISEYTSTETPYRARFLERNRIVAGLSQLTVVVESPIKGGAMSTATLAFNYNRDVMAVPGRVTDEASAGCNHLIRKEKAHLLTAAADIIEQMNWEPMGVKVTPKQRILFPEMTGLPKQIFDILKYEASPIALDTLHNRLNVKISELMASLTELEFDGVIVRHPGNRYALP
ncbi:MAG: DNA-processing protein DprA [Muribaculaceae bacterium]|nr:DNA-processing protein DprA [Muribaculaceae bacterium]